MLSLGSQQPEPQKLRRRPPPTSASAPPSTAGWQRPDWPDSPFRATSQLQLQEPHAEDSADRISGQRPPGGTAIATFTIASTERWKNSAGEPQEHTEWFNIKVFGKRAEVIAEYLHKGGRIFLEGRQRTESWDDKQSGGKKYMMFVYADRVDPASSR